MEPKPFKAGDACPNCDGPMRAAKVPTPAQRAAAVDRTEPTPLPAHYDTAAPEFVEEHGALHRCDACGYVARAIVPAKKSTTKGADA